MYQHLSIPILPAVKLAICTRRIINGDVVTDDEAGVGDTGDDEVAQVAVVGFDVALACCEGETLGRRG